VIADPPVRKDGCCAQCGGERKHAVWNKYGKDQAILDPFCSSTCCRAYFEVSLPPTKYVDPDANG